MLAILALLVAVYIYNCAAADEHFYIPQNIVTGGDFHIQPIGAIADQGSFANDMSSYFRGQGPI